MWGRGVLPLCAIVTLAGLLGGCGDQTSQPRRDPFAYDRDRPLAATVKTVSRKGAVRVQRVVYTAADGQRVPALLAVPRRTEPKGCLIYQGGAGSTKEQASRLWPSAAALGLATFTIETRHTGARAADPRELLHVLASADRVATMIRDDVIDLRRGVDYLSTRPECRRNIGFLGTSQGALLGALLAGDDPRIHAVVLTSLGATWRSALLYDTDVLVPGVTERPRAMEAALRKLDGLDAADWIGRISPRPVMIVDGLRDPRIPVVEALNLAAAAREPKTLMLHRGGHDPFGPPDGDRVNDRIGLFLLNQLVDYDPS